jgi:hypothetical protein
MKLMAARIREIAGVSGSGFLTPRAEFATISKLRGRNALESK